ncbi:hypothetical protein FHS91_002489 [Sphingobium xanthum]|uniref:hypothetical protein n=1 Tax=Sphingobium xanthum TaxID=1387165 RepID=UPI001C8BE65F|nr:hypothetical protein [Sphingobium xanthum]
MIFFDQAIFSTIRVKCTARGIHERHLELGIHTDDSPLRWFASECCRSSIDHIDALYDVLIDTKCEHMRRSSRLDLVRETGWAVLVLLISNNTSSLEEIASSTDDPIDFVNALSEALD